jgi:heptosyltransferase I
MGQINRHRRMADKVTASLTLDLQLAHSLNTFIDNPPRSLCLFRLSAIGDCCNMVPVVRTLQTFLPQTQISWVIGHTEAQLLAGLDDVELIVHDKRQGPLALRRQLAGRQFDLLMLMQWSLRAGLTASVIKASVRVGYDRARSKDLHGLFINQRIADIGPGHVVDGFFGFTEALGIPGRVARWDIPIPEDAEVQADALMEPDRRTLIISPCSSRPVRNWNIPGYAAVARHAFEKYDMQVLVTGGRDATDQQYASAITDQLKGFVPVQNLAGRTDLKTLLALMKRAEVVVAPDSGPMHMAMAAGTPAIGLFAETNPDRAAPILCRQWVVNAYPQAVRKAFDSEVSEVRWGRRIGQPWAMNLITVEEVIERFDELMTTPVPDRLMSGLERHHRTPFMPERFR